MENRYNNLQVGQIYKSYRQVCEALGEKVVTSNSKKAQLKEWERHFSYHKDGNKFIIDEIFETPLPKMENNKNLAEYIPYLELLLMKLLQQEDRNTLTISTSELASRLSVIHSDFKEYFNKRQKLSEILNVNIDRINEFFSSTNDSFKGAVNTTINRLKSRQAILYEQRWMVMKYGYNVEFDKYTNLYEFATDDEKEKVLNARYVVLELMGGNMNKLRASGEILHYYRMVDKMLEEDYGIKRAYKVHVITINQSIIENEYIKQLKNIYGDDSGELREIAKELFANRNISKALNRQELAEQSKLEHGYNSLNAKESSRVEFGYIKDMNLLNDALILKGVNKTCVSLQKVGQ